MNKFWRFLNLDLDGKAMLLAAVGYLLIGRILVAALPIQNIFQMALAGQREPSVAAPAHDRAPGIAWAIGVACQYVPWRSDCLVRSVAALLWARRAGLDPVFHLGIKQEDASEMLAHTWLTVGEIYVTDPGAPNAFSPFGNLSIR